jgi:hypothetical protein
MKKIAIIFITVMVLGIFGCERDWLDINIDPNVPTQADPAKLLTGAQTHLGEAFSQENFVGNPLLSFVHQLVSREYPQYNYAASGTMGNTWWWAYTNVGPNLDELIVSAEEAGNLRYAGIAKILKAYTFSVMVDLWGDVPYSDYNIPGLIHPTVDPGAQIYNGLLALIDEAIADLNNQDASNLLSPAADDLIYGGNIARWVRLGNTLKLRLLINTRRTPENITGHGTILQNLVTADNFIGPDEDFEFWFNASVSPDQRHPAFKDEYDGGQITYYISPWFYEIMRGLTFNATNNPFAGLQDPRVPYYWVNQLTGGEPAQNPHEYRHGNFVSIVFGTIGPYADGAQRESATMIGLYPAGGKFDDGTGSTGGLGRADGTGVAPQKFITYASLNFMLAEHYHAAGNAPLARDAYEEAVRAAFAHVNKVVARTGQEGVPALTAAAINEYVDDLLDAYDAASPDRKLEMIMTQKWIHNFFNPVESYTDYRRTGYPVLFDPLPGTVVIPVDNAGAISESPVQLIRRYPKSLWYPQREVELNPNVVQKTNLSESRVFWDNRTYDY